MTSVSGMPSGGGNSLNGITAYEGQKSYLYDLIPCTPFFASKSLETQDHYVPAKTPSSENEQLRKFKSELSSEPIVNPTTPSIAAAPNNPLTSHSTPIDEFVGTPIPIIVGGIEFGLGGVLTWMGEKILSPLISFGLNKLVKKIYHKKRPIELELASARSFSEGVKSIQSDRPDVLTRLQAIREGFKFLYENPQHLYDQEKGSAYTAKDAKDMFEWTTQEGQDKLTYTQIITAALDVYEEAEGHKKVKQTIWDSILNATSEAAKELDLIPRESAEVSKTITQEILLTTNKRYDVELKVIKNILTTIVHEITTQADSPESARVKVGPDVVVIEGEEKGAFLETAKGIIETIEAKEILSPAEENFISYIKEKYPVVQESINLAVEPIEAEIEAKRMASELRQFSNIDEPLGKGFTNLSKLLAEEQGEKRAGLVVMDELGEELIRQEIQWEVKDGVAKLTASRPEKSHYIGPYSFERGKAFIIKGEEAVKDGEAIRAIDQNADGFYIVSTDQKEIKKAVREINKSAKSEAEGPKKVNLSRTKLGRATLKVFNQLQVINKMLGLKFKSFKGSESKKIEREAMILRRQNLFNRFNQELNQAIEDYQRQRLIIEPVDAEKQLEQGLITLRDKYDENFSDERRHEFKESLRELEAVAVENKKGKFEETHMRIDKLMADQLGLTSTQEIVPPGCLRSDIKAVGDLSSKDLYKLHEQYINGDLQLSKRIRYLIDSRNLRPENIELGFHEVQSLMENGDYEKAIFNLRQTMGSRMKPKHRIRTLLALSRCSLELKWIKHARLYMNQARRMAYLWGIKLPVEAHEIEARINEYYDIGSEMTREISPEAMEKIRTVIKEWEPSLKMYYGYETEFLENVARCETPEAIESLIVKLRGEKKVSTTEFDAEFGELLYFWKEAREKAFGDKITITEEIPLKGLENSGQYNLEELLAEKTADFDTREFRFRPFRKAFKSTVNFTGKAIKSTANFTGKVGVPSFLGAVVFIGTGKGIEEVLEHTIGLPETRLGALGQGYGTMGLAILLDRPVQNGWGWVVRKLDGSPKLPATTPFSFSRFVANLGLFIFTYRGISGISQNSGISEGWSELIGMTGAGVVHGGSWALISTSAPNVAKDLLAFNFAPPAKGTAEAVSYGSRWSPAFLKGARYLRIGGTIYAVVDAAGGLADGLLSLGNTEAEDMALNECEADISPPVVPYFLPTFYRNACRFYDTVTWLADADVIATRASRIQHRLHLGESDGRMRNTALEINKRLSYTIGAAIRKQDSPSLKEIINGLNKDPAIPGWLQRWHVYQKDFLPPSEMHWLFKSGAVAGLSIKEPQAIAYWLEKDMLQILNSLKQYQEWRLYYAKTVSESDKDIKLAEKAIENVQRYKKELQKLSREHISSKPNATSWRIDVDTKIPVLLTPSVH